MNKLIILSVICMISQLSNAQGKNFIDLPYIEVTGKADTLVTPDEIYIRIVLSEKDTRDRISIEDLEQRMVDTLKRMGINIESDLTTSDMISNFKYYVLKSKDIVKTKMYTLKLKDAPTASRVFIKLEEIGISNASVERVNHSAIDNLKNKMRIKAIADAKEHAVALTKPLNQTVGAAIHIIDTDAANPVVLQEGLVSIQVRGISSFADDSKQLTRIDFQKIRVAAGVSAKFMLK